MKLDILTPNKKLFSGEINSVCVPGTMGTFTVLNDHAPLVSTLEKGKIQVNGGASVFKIQSGVIEVLNNKVVILAKS